MRRFTSVFIALTIMLFVSAHMAEARNSDTCARILKKEGTVEVAGKPADTGALIPSGQTIQTGKKSKAYIKLKDRSVIMLRAETRIKVLKSGWKNYEIKVLSGRALMVLKPDNIFMRNMPGKRPPHHTIRSEIAVAGVRGTGLFVMVEGEDSTYFCVCFGTVDVAASTDPTVKESITAEHHKAVRVRKDGDSFTIEKAPMLGHTDEEVKYLKGLLKERF